LPTFKRFVLTLPRTIPKQHCGLDTASLTTLESWLHSLSSVRHIRGVLGVHCERLSIALIGSFMMYPKMLRPWRYSTYGMAHDKNRSSGPSDAFLPLKLGQEGSRFSTRTRINLLALQSPPYFRLCTGFTPFSSQDFWQESLVVPRPITIPEFFIRGVARMLESSELAWTSTSTSLWFASMRTTGKT